MGRYLAWKAVLISAAFISRVRRTRVLNRNMNWLDLLVESICLYALQRMDWRGCPVDSQRPLRRLLYLIKQGDLDQWCGQGDRKRKKGIWEAFRNEIYKSLWSTGFRLCLELAAAAAAVSTLWDPIDSSPPGSHPWDSPGKNTGVGCHFLLQCMKVKSESEVAQSCPTLSNPWTATYQAPPSMGFSRQEYWIGVPLPSPVVKTTFFQFTGCGFNPWSGK